ncbi:NAD(P)-binding domain-containing protein, partial [Cobetia marina]
MQLGIIGLGRMGGNIARRLMRNGHEVVAHDRDEAIAQSLVADGATHVDNLAALVQQLKAPRAVWVMLPAGEITEQTISALAELMEAGDTIIDGGNTFYKDDIRRAATLKDKGLNYVDVGTSGGVWGLERGYCMMIGAEKAVFDHLEPLFDTLAPGYG